MNATTRTLAALLALSFAAAAQATPSQQAPPATAHAQPLRLASRGLQLRDASGAGGTTLPADPAASATSRSGGGAGSPADGSYASSACGVLAALASHGQAVPGGGFLDPVAFVNPTTVSANGQLAFFSQVTSSPFNQNQVIFIADAAGLHPIAHGTGAGGGSGNPGMFAGDPAPGGGFFTGMFSGTFFAPAFGGGNVLFLSDVKNGPSPRGLFMRLANSFKTVIARVGDPSPLGGTFSEVGPGVVNAAGIVLFLARTGASPDVNIFRWSSGAVSTFVKVGDPAPGGGSYTMLGTESVGFVDGTSMPVGPLPAINDAGQVAFRAIVGSQHRLVVITAGVPALYAKSGDPTPAGGTYDGFQAPNLNEWGEISFFADFQPTPGNFNSGLFAGAPGHWRKAISFFDPLPGGGICFGLAFSRNPMTPYDDAGNLLFWTDAQLPGGAMQERLVVSAADGTLETLASKGQPTPLGGTLGSLQSWPSMHDGVAGVSASTPGAAGGALSAHFDLPGALTWEDMGFALAGTAGPPRLRGAGTLVPGSPGAMTIDRARPNAPTYVLSGLMTAFVPFKGGTLVPDNALPPVFVVTSNAGTLDLQWSAWPAGLSPCREFYVQAWIVDPAGPQGVAATNGLLGRAP